MLTEKQRIRAGRRYVRRLLGRHDRWSHPMLANVPRRAARDLAGSGFGAKFLLYAIGELYSPERVMRLTYPENPLLAMVAREPLPLERGSLT